MPLVLESSESLLGPVSSGNTFFGDFVLWPVSVCYCLSHLFWLGWFSQVSQKGLSTTRPWDFPTTWHGNVGVYDRFGPLCLDIPKSEQPLTSPACAWPVFQLLSSFALPWVRFILLPFSYLPGPHKLEKGEVAMGRVVKVTPKEGLTVSFPFGKIGRVSVFHLSDSYSETPLEDFVPQKVVR